MRHDAPGTLLVTVANRVAIPGPALVHLAGLSRLYWRNYGEGECMWVRELLRRDLLLRRAGLLLQVSRVLARPRRGTC